MFETISNAKYRKLRKADYDYTHFLKHHNFAHAYITFSGPTLPFPSIFKVVYLFKSIMLRVKYAEKLNLLKKSKNFWPFWVFKAKARPAAPKTL
jgi:hypothetical protein